MKLFQWFMMFMILFEITVIEGKEKENKDRRITKKKEFYVLEETCKDFEEECAISWECCCPFYCISYGDSSYCDYF